MLYELAQAQKKLNAYINKKKGITNDDFYGEKNLALLVELGELANELQFFKYWKDDPKPKLNGTCDSCKGRGKHVYGGSFGINCTACNGTGLDENSNPVLEEYVDVIHMALTYTLFSYDDSELRYLFGSVSPIEHVDLTSQFADLYFEISGSGGDMYSTWRLILGLGNMLDFSTETIEEAYYKKNKENFKRQDNGY